MSGEPKILLMRLFERTSANGNRYMFGRLGNAKIIAFIEGMPSRSTAPKSSGACTCRPATRQPAPSAAIKGTRIVGTTAPERAAAEAVDEWWRRRAPVR